MNLDGSEELSVNPAKTQWGLVDAAVTCNQSQCIDLSVKYLLLCVIVLKIDLQSELQLIFDADQEKCAFRRYDIHLHKNLRLLVHVIDLMTANIYYPPGKYIVSGIKLWDL